MNHLCDSDSCTGHNRCSATAAIATDRAAVVRDNAAGNVTGSNVVAARADAVAGSGSSGVVASPGDSVGPAAAVRLASCAGARCCYRGCCHRACHSSLDCCLDRDCGPAPGDVAAQVVAVAVAAAPPHRGSVAAAGAVVPNAAAVPDRRAVAVDVAAASALRVHEIAGSAVAAVARCVVVAGAAVPNAAAVPGCRVVAVDAVVPSAVVVPDCRAVVPGVAVPCAAVVLLVLVVLVPGAGSDVPLAVVRALPGFPDSAPHHDPVVPARWRHRSLLTTACRSPAII